ncbi:hypothetical protein BT69DRAFT_1291471 [Atractiella rhizophila]|nr:hypothetical protein BT69DRAFT_1291471 [Atractiella rhizophila]
MTHQPSVFNRCILGMLHFCESPSPVSPALASASTKKDQSEILGKLNWMKLLGKWAN